MRISIRLLLYLISIPLFIGCAPAPTPAPTAAPPTSVFKPTNVTRVSSNPTNTPYIAQQESIPIAPKLNNLAPSFSLSDTSGKTYDLRGLRGYPILLNFWATWCGPCLGEMPALQSLFNRYKSQGLNVIAVNGDGESLSDISTYQRKYGLGFPLLIDIEEKVRTSYGIDAFPTSFFIDKAGIIKYINVGSLNEQEFDKILKSTILVNNTSSVTSVDNRGSLKIQLPGEFWSYNISESHLYRSFAVSEKEFSNFAVQSDVIIKSDTHEYHGVFFRQRDSKNFYTFRITPDGSFAFDVWRSGDDSFDTILGPTKSNNIHQGVGQTNTLKVIANNESFSLYINGQYVGSVSDNRFRSGKVGVILCTCNGSLSASGTFLNFSLFDQP